MINFLLVTFQFVTFIVFISYIIHLNGNNIPDSISESYRILKKSTTANSLKAQLFILFLAAISVPLHIMIQSASSFWCMVGIILVGVAPEFWKKSQEKIHVISATLGIFLGFLAIGLLPGWHTWLWFVPQILTMGILKYAVRSFDFHSSYIFGKTIYRRHPVKNYTFWIETSAVILIILAETIHLI